MTRFTVDVEELFVQLLAREFAEATVQSVAEVDAVEHLPMIIVSTGQGQMVANGKPGMGWSWGISLSILHETRDQAADLADAVYQAMHGFHDQQSGVSGVGYVNSMEDDSMPSRTATTEVGAGGITQYDGSWTAVVRKYPSGA